MRNSKVIALFFSVFMFTIGFSAKAQVSFSAIPDSENSTKSARLYSESSGGFVLTAAGCRWDVVDLVDRTSSKGSYTNNFIIGASREVSANGGIIRVVGVLSNGRRLYPSSVNCSHGDNMYNTVILFDYTNKNGIKRKALLAKSGEFLGRWTVDRDFFTPEQEREAWSIAKGASLEILGAWLSRPTNR